MTFPEQMQFALDLYAKGTAPVLKNKNGVVLHGQETLDAGMKPGEFVEIREVDISPEHWKVSHWPLTLESARQHWLGGK
jgi:hypothetical protein